MAQQIIPTDIEDMESKLFDIKSKLTDQEYIDLMNNLSNIKNKEHNFYHIYYFSMHPELNREGCGEEGCDCCADRSWVTHIKYIKKYILLDGEKASEEWKENEWELKHLIGQQLFINNGENWETKLDSRWMYVGGREKDHDVYVPKNIIYKVTKYH